MTRHVQVETVYYVKIDMPVKIQEASIMSVTSTLYLYAQYSTTGIASGDTVQQ